VLSNGDYSAWPFATLAAAYAAIPPHGKRVLVNVAAGSFVGPPLRGKHGAEVIVKGTVAAVTLTTGVTSGTAGAGTTSTAVKKPGAAANWTASEMRGKRALLLITGGAGYTASDVYGKNLIEILDNTVDTLVLPAENAAINNTTTFQIVTPTTKITTVAATAQPFTGSTFMLGIFNCTADVHHVAIAFEAGAADYNILTKNSLNARFRGCVIKGGTSKLEGGNAAFSCCHVYSSAIIKASVERFEFLRNALTAASLWTYRSHVVDVDLDVDGDSGTLNGLTIENAVCALVSGTIKNCASGTPYLLKSVQQSVSLVVGANAGTPRGMEISKGGQHIATGSSIAGSWANELLIEGHPTSFAMLAARGAMMDRGTFVHWGSGAVELLNKFVVNPVASDVSGGTQTISPGNALVVQGEAVVSNAEKSYGVEYNVNYAEITAGATQTQGGATLVGFRDTVVVAGNTDDGVRLLAMADINQAGGVGGMKGRVWNDTAAALKLWPPVGKQVYLAGTGQGADIAVAVPAGAVVEWLLTASADYRIRIN
jgi:hypothetical protein